MSRIFLLVLIFTASFNDLLAQYEEEILSWRKERLQALVKEDGWATLAGLFPIQNGTQFFGAQVERLKFPDFVADTLGKIILKRDSIKMFVHSPARVVVNNQETSKALLWPYKSPVVCNHGSLQWFVIKRGDRFLVRLRDRNHPARTQLKSIPYFTVDSTWRFEATFHPHDSAKLLPLPNALGMIVDGESTGYLTFSYRGRNYTLQALDEGQDDLFIIFYDQTSGKDTYGGGRYMYVKKPGANGKTILDFNKAYSPPCAFTPFATCLYPPQENRLDLRITAGEKDPHFLDHD